MTATTIASLLEQACCREAGAIALLDPCGHQLTYRDLMRCVAGMGGNLQAHGLGSSSRVALLLPQGIDAAVAFLGVACHAVAAPLRPDASDAELDAVLDDLGIDALVTLPDMFPRALEAATRRGIPTLAPGLAEAPACAPNGTLPGPEDPALILRTSGSTGRPKTVALAQSNLAVTAARTAEALELSAADRCLTMLPLVHVHGLVSGLLVPLAAGSSVAVTPPFEAHHVPAWLEGLQPTWIPASPAMHLAMLERLRAYGPCPCRRLRFLRSGSTPLWPELIDQLRKCFGVPVIEAYGMSEVPHISANPIHSPRSGSVGKAIVDELAILDNDGHILPAGREGCIAVRGRTVMAGYLSPEQANGEAFREGWFITGDQGYLDADGYLYLSGRSRERINRGGNKLMPLEVDQALLRHPAVREASTFAVPHVSLGEDVAAAVTLHPNSTTDERTLRQFVRQHLSPHKIPSRVLIVPDLPKAASGKVQRHTIFDHFRPLLEASGEPPRGEDEQRVARLFEELLSPRLEGTRSLGREDHFFLLGGDSLLGGALISRLAAEGWPHLTPSTLFENPTVALLAAQLTDRRPTIDSIPAAEPLPVAVRERCRAYPASFSQARLWFLQQLEPNLSAYHMPAVWRLRGELDIPALEQALGALIKRHPTLRTSFRLEGSEPLQIIHPPAAFPLRAEPLADRDPEKVIDAWLEQESSTPFDLTGGLLLRARLLAVGERDHLLLLNHHHIASDGWSVTVLARDLAALYNAHRTGRTPELPLLRAHYQDYAAWQRQRLNGERLEQLLAYWRPQLSGLEPLELPCDHPRPAIPTYQGRRVSFRIGPELLVPFEALCRSEGATLQMGLLAVVALLLQRYSRKEDFAIGVPIWGRNHPDLEGLIGFFINTLPIRTLFRSDPSFRQLLAEVRQTSLAAYDHQELPFERMVEALNVERDTRRNPLVQVMLQLIELPAPSLSGLEGLEVEAPISPTASARLDLEFYLRRSERGGLQGDVVYATDLFEAERIERLTSHLETLLASLLEAPDAAATSLNLLPDSERQRIERWRQGPRIEVPDLCVHQLFEQQVERTPEATALIFKDQELTYAELNARANRLAHHLIDRGVGSEVIVGVCLERSVELIVSLLAILKAGGAYLPLDPSWPRERQELLLSQAGCEWLLIGGPLKPRHGGWQGTILSITNTGAADSAVGGSLEPALRSPAGAAEDGGKLAPVTPAGRRLAYLTYTSGSTGVPKGVAIEHRSILRLVDPANGFRLGPGALVLQLAPLAFDAATFEIWGPLLGGGTLVLAPPGMPALGELADLLRRKGITTLWLTAGLFHAMVEQELQALAGVGQVLAGGDVLSPDHVQRLLHAFPPAHELINGYGPTENTTFTCCQRMAAGEVVDPQRLPIGRPIALTEVHVLDPAGMPCPIGIPGELHIGGAGLARGYLLNPGLTAETFLPDPFSADPTARLYKSGDLASWNPDGTLAFHGRIDQQIKLRGFRIEPGEIEANLLAHPAVAQAVVLLRQDDPANPRLIGYWVGEAGVTVSAEELRGFLAERLPDFMVPAALVELEALPLTSNGKVDRRALPAPSFAGDRERRLKPGTELERRLHGIWAEVLGHGEFGIEANFFELGGHSLSAASLSARIEQKLGRRLPISVLFRAPTILQLARWLEHEGLPAGNGFRSLVTLQSGGEDPPLFVVHGGQGTVYIHLHLARCLAPDRPVYGLQAVGFDGSEPRHSSVEEMAAHYADEILRFRPHGPYHLLGYSGGGWYAWAVAAELRRRGGSLGLVGMVDTGGTADLHRRLRLQQLLLRKLHKLPVQARRWILRGSGNRRTVLREKWNALRFIGWSLLRPRGQKAPQASDPDAMPRPTQPLRGDYFIQLHTYYRPPRLPVRTDIFAAVSSGNSHRRLWNFYARGRAHIHPCLDQHTDFFRAEQMPDVAQELTAVLRRIEAQNTP